MSTEEKCKECSAKLQLERFRSKECSPLTCTVCFNGDTLDNRPELIAKLSEENWTPYLECQNSQELWIRLHQAELDQIELEELKNANMIHVRGRLVGGVDKETKVRLKLHTENRPALSFSRRGTDLMVLVFLDQWER